MMTTDLWVPAVHESAHAVACLATGGKVRRLDLYPEGRPGRRGGLLLGLTTTFLRRGDALHAAITSLGGPAAELHLLGGYRYDAGATDLEAARKALEGSGIAMDQAWRRAEAIVSRNWLGILAVAAALQAARHLDGDRVRQIAGLG
jgi:hypothetical protein